MFWRDVRGHDAVIERLRRAIRAGRVSSSYLFTGPAGVGRRTLMRAFAGALLCETEGEDACGTCGNCRLLANDRHPDLVVLEREKERVTVDEMRAFCRQVNLRATESRRRVGLVADADAMTDQAANCFLKTLEEPPFGVTLLLRSESTDRLLRTIVSRCPIIRVAPLPAETVAAALRDKHGLDAALAGTLALLAEGSIGAAEALGEGAAAADWQWIVDWPGSLRAGDSLRFAEELLKRAARRREDGASARHGTQAMLDLLALRFRKTLREGAATRASVQALEAIWRAGERLEANVMPDLVLRGLALDLAAGTG